MKIKDHLIVQLQHKRKNGILWNQEINIPCISIPRASYERHIIYIIEEDILINDMIIIIPYDSKIIMPIDLYLNSTLLNIIIYVFRTTF